LEIFGPNPDRSFRLPGIDRLIAVGNQVGPGEVSGALYPVRNVTNTSNDAVIAETWGTVCRQSTDDCLLPGQPVPEGWLIAPRDSQVSALSAEAVDRIISDGVVKAQTTRAAIRLDIDNGFRPGVATGMVLAVADTNGELLGVFRMPDATVFSIDVAVAKARNTAYYADGDDLQDEDRVDFDGDGKFGPTATSINDPTGDTVPLGTALTNRTFRFLSEPRYPGGIDIPASAGNGLANEKDLNVCDQQRSLCLQIGPQSILRMPGIHPGTAENLIDAEPLPSAVYQFSPDLNPSGRNNFSVLAFDAFNQSRNFRDPGDAQVMINGATNETGKPIEVFESLANQNGVIFFPGSAALFSENGDRLLIGGFGVSGDGVDQDDVVTAAAQVGFEPIAENRVDHFTVAGVRLPYQKFNRSPIL
ncbi:MAG: hypothetical protein MK161_17535, partial [Pirellulales bacterium]|nr:hypothetical protein [Pirellulales bacterium]